MARPAAPDEIRDAASVVIPAAEFAAVQAMARNARAREEKSLRRVAVVRWGLVFALSMAAVAEGAAIVTMMPLKQFIPVFSPVRADGTLGASSELWDSLPPEHRETNLLTTLWGYVECRESWASATAEKCWTVVSAMSSRQVRDQFQGWYRKENPDSPQRIYGEKATVKIEFRSVDKLPGSDDAYAFRFARIASDAPTGLPPTFVAPLRFRRLGKAEALPWWQRVTFNAPALQVWEYRGATQEGVSIR